MFLSQEEQQLKKFKDQEFPNNIKLYELAVTDKNQHQIEFYESWLSTSKASLIREYNHSSSILPAKAHKYLNPWIKFYPPYTVNSITLDAWAELENIEQIDFMWIDAQGAEKFILQGATKTLLKVRFLYVEYSLLQLYSGQFTLKSLLDNLKNFEIVCIFRDDVMLKNKYKI